MLRRFLSRRRPSDAPVPLVLYTRRECHLCDAMKAELARARVRRPFELREVDVDGDAELAARFGRSVPVLEIAGRGAFKGRMEVSDFERKFERLVRERPRRSNGGSAS